MKKAKRILSMLLVTVMMLTLLSACGGNVAKNPWAEKEKQMAQDMGYDNPEYVTDENGETVTDENGLAVIAGNGSGSETGEPVTDENGEAVTNENGEQVTENTGDVNNGDVNNDNGNNNGGSNNGGSNNGGSNNGGSNNGGGNSGTTTTTKSGGGNNNGTTTTTKSGGGNNGGGNNGGGSTSSLPSTPAEILEYYKKAANPIKTMSSGVTVTRTRETYRDNGGDMGGASAAIIKKAFSEGDNTDEKTYSTQSDIKKSFIVEKEDYVCALAIGDIKSATIQQSGDNVIVKISVKDDTSDTNISNKCISSAALAGVAKPLSVGKLKSVSCKNVTVEGTINAKGQLIKLSTHADYYFYSKDEYFSCMQEQDWKVVYG